MVKTVATEDLIRSEISEKSESLRQSEQMNEAVFPEIAEELEDESRLVDMDRLFE